MHFGAWWYIIVFRLNEISGKNDERSAGGPVLMMIAVESVERADGSSLSDY